ncbi:MAG: acyl-CoA desaturase [Chloroflexi bacterium]|nr:acyl-CoA desaturase [Chloroflexota bacterium]
MQVAAPRPLPRLSQPVGHRVFNIAVALVVIVPFLALLQAIHQLWDHGVGWTEMLLLVGLYLPISLGVTVGFHRMLTHKSFVAHPIVKFTLLVLGSMSLEGNPIKWAADHLLHHQLSDKEGDPHSPTDGLWHAHLGWLFSGKVADPAFYCPALLNDPIITFVDRTYLVWVALSLVIPFMIAGWQGLIWGGLVRIFFVHHVTWSINSVCHTWGARPYATDDRSRNNWFVGLLAMGEGFHNSHHRWPRAAIHGMDRWQLDVSAWLIQLLEKAHLATDVCRISLETRLRNRKVPTSATT